MKKTISIVLLCLFTGCSTSYYVKRDTKRLDGLSLQYPAEFASLANKLDPCFTGQAKSDTLTKQTVDTIFNSVERLIPGKPGQPDTVYMPGKIIRDNILTTIHDTLADNRALTACAASGKTSADSLLSVKTMDTQLSAEKGSLVKWVIGLALALLLITGISIYKFLSGGAITGLIKNAV